MNTFATYRSYTSLPTMDGVSMWVAGAFPLPAPVAKVARLLPGAGRPVGYLGLGLSSAEVSLSTAEVSQSTMEASQSGKTCWAITE